MHGLLSRIPSKIFLPEKGGSDIVGTSANQLYKELARVKSGKRENFLTIYYNPVSYSGAGSDKSVWPTKKFKAEMRAKFAELEHPVKGSLILLDIEFDTGKQAVLLAENVLKELTNPTNEIQIFEEFYAWHPGSKMFCQCGFLCS